MSKHEPPTKTTEDLDVSAWVGAFRAANAKDPDHMPHYERGWFVWRDRVGYFRSRARRKDLKAMTANLLERANGKHT